MRCIQSDFWAALPDFLMVAAGLSNTSGRRGPGLEEGWKSKVREALCLTLLAAAAADFVKRLLKLGWLLKAS